MGAAGRSHAVELAALATGEQNRGNSRMWASSSVKADKPKGDWGALEWTASWGGGGYGESKVREETVWEVGGIVHFRRQRQIGLLRKA